MLFLGYLDDVSPMEIAKWPTVRPISIDRKRDEWVDILAAIHNDRSVPLKSLDAKSATGLSLTHAFYARSHATTRRADIILDRLSSQSNKMLVYYRDGHPPDEFWDTPQEIALVARDDYSLEPRPLRCPVSIAASAPLPCDGELLTDLEIRVVRDNGDSLVVTHKTRVTTRIE